MTRTTANLVLLGTAAIWGLAFVFQKTAMDHMGPYLFVALRSFIACAALLPVALSERPGGAPLLPGGLVRVASLGGVMFFLGALLQQIGLVTATVTNTGFLTGLYVVITPLLVWVFFRRAPVRHVWLAVGLAFVGTWFLGGGTVGGLSYGDVLVAVSALFWAGHMLVIEASSHHGRPIMFTCIQFAVTGVLGLAGAFAFETVSLSAIAGAWQELLYVGLLSSALTFALLAVAMKHTQSSDAAILVSMETVFAALAAAVLLGERLTPLAWAGAVMMFAATLIVQLAPFVDRRRWRPPSAPPAS